MKRFFALTIFLLLASFGYAQFYNGSQLNFGKNRVQHQDFFWQYYRTLNYDIYYYPNSKSLAEYTYLKAEFVIQEMIQQFGYTPSKKFQFFVYNTKSDFLESNFGFDNENFYNQGGVASIYGSKIFLYFDGNHNHFDAMMRAGIAQLFALQIVEGPSVSANISSNYMMELPNWFYPGLASYIANPWSTEIETYVKNGIITRKYDSLDDLSVVDATYAGHSFFKFISDRYGEDKVIQILYLVRNLRSVEGAFERALESSYTQLLVDWYRYYFVFFKKEDKKMAPLDAGEVHKAKTRRTYHSLALSPTTEAYAYVTNESGQIKIWLQLPEAPKAKVIYRKYQKTEDNPDLTFPILAWHPSGEWLGFTIEDKGRCYYYPYELETKKWQPRMLIYVEKITDWSFAPDGRSILFSGYDNGQSDIFLYNLQARAFKNITNDFYDDFAPRFINHQKDIIFSSNRTHDSLKNKATFYNTVNGTRYDLFLYHYDKNDPKLLRVTHTPHADETYAIEVAPNKVVFLSDENGINNRYVATFDSAITKIDTAIHYAYFAKNAPQSYLSNSILEQDFSPATQTIGSINFNYGIQRIYLDSYTNTTREALPLSEIKKEFTAIETLNDSILEMEEIERSLKPPVVKRSFHQVRQSDVRNELREKKQNENQLSIPSTNNDTLGIIDSLAIIDTTPPAPFTPLYEFTPIVPRNYDVQFNINKLATQLDFNFMNASYQQFTGATTPIYLNMGFNALFLVGITDLMEDYRITGGFRPSLSFDGAEFMLSFEFLKKRLDKQIVIHRQSLKENIGYAVYKQKINNIFFILKYPFNKFNALGLTFGARYETQIVGAVSDATLVEPATHGVWGSVKLEYIFDSSKELFTNTWHGSKMKFFVEYQQEVAKESQNLLVLGFDMRRSVRVYKNMVWANRLAASTNVGSGRLIYYMGGVDNWMNAHFNSGTYVDPAKNYHYQALATSMRGFSQNIRNGTSFMVFTSELRIPFVQLIAGRKIANNFFNSLQAVPFVDFGTAWTGLTPYSDENGLYTRIVTSGPIDDPYLTATVTRQVDPWVLGLGIGARASLFGYFLRLDYAWGFEDFKPYYADRNGALYFSIGLDF